MTAMRARWSCSSLVWVHRPRSWSTTTSGDRGCAFQKALPAANQDECLYEQHRLSVSVSSKIAHRCSKLGAWGGPADARRERRHARAFWETRLSSELTSLIRSTATRGWFPRTTLSTASPSRTETLRATL
jgi:hypothetical protein